MSKAYLEGFGYVEFDPMNYDNNVYDRYVVYVSEDAGGEIVDEINCADFDDYRDELYSTPGRTVIDTDTDEIDTTVDYGGDDYGVRVIYHIAHVVDED